MRSYKEILHFVCRDEVGVLSNKMIKVSGTGITTVISFSVRYTEKMYENYKHTTQK